MSKMSKAIAVLGVVAGLGVAALPLSSYAVATPASDNTTAQAIVGEAIEIAITDTDGYIKINGGTPITAGQKIWEGEGTVNVKTNAAGGYEVKIKDTDGTELALTSSDTGNTTKIPASSLTDLTLPGWGFKASSESTNVDANASASYRAIVAGANGLSLATGTTATGEDGDDIKLTFGVVVDTTIPADTYENNVTLTASTK